MGYSSLVQKRWQNRTFQGLFTMPGLKPGIAKFVVSPDPKVTCVYYPVKTGYTLILGPISHLRTFLEMWLFLNFTRWVHRLIRTVPMSQSAIFNLIHFWNMDPKAFSLYILYQSPFYNLDTFAWTVTAGWNRCDIHVSNYVYVIILIFE